MDDANQKPPFCFQKPWIWELSFDAIPDWIAIIDNDFKLRRINKAMAEKLQIQQADAVGSICYEIIHSSEAPPAFCPHAQLIADGQEHSAEFYEENLNCHLLVSVSPIHDPDGDMIGCVHVARDISRQKSTESKLQNAFKEMEWRVAERTRNLKAANDSLASEIKQKKRLENRQNQRERQYRRMVENLGDNYLLYRHYPDGTLTYVSPSIREMFGVPADDAIGMKWRDLADWSPESIARIRKIAKAPILGDSNGLVSMELEYVHPDGTSRIIEVTAHQVVTEGIVISIEGIAHDVTRRIELTKEREKLILDLRRALGELKTLSGLLPICANCKKVRDDKGYWNQIEDYVAQRSEARFSHGICPDCARQLYPEIYSHKE